MHKRIVYSIIGILACTYAYAQSFCHLVQPIGTSYEETIETAGTYYYSAMTFDLPMDVTFTTLDPTCSAAPQIWADLTCTPGIYSDPNIQDLVRDTVKYGISVPMSINCETDIVDGHYVHHLKIGKSYRDKLKLVGVDYSVPAYVKVVMPCAGTVHMEQDTSSLACINEARRIGLTDGTRILANDSLSTYIFLFKDWLKEADSVALYWDGPEPAHIWLAGNNCEFETDVQHTWDNLVIPANSEYHLDKNYLNDGVKEVQDTTGFLFAKIVSSEEGILSSRPLMPDLKGATLLRYNKPQNITTTNGSFYCFPNDWKTVEWIANTRKVVKMYLHTSPEEAAIDSFKFDLQDSVHRVLLWTKPEMKIISAKATSPLLYVRFSCSREEFTLTAYDESDVTSCVGSSIRLRPGQTMISGKSQIIGLYYEDIEGDSLVINCVNNNSSDMQGLFIADTCEFVLRWNMASTQARCVFYQKTVRGGGSITIDSTEIARWKRRVTPEGYLYVRTTADGTITFTTTKPEEQDPEGDDPEDPVGPTTSIVNSRPATECRKIMHNGQIYIMRAGKTYTITGQVVML